MCCAARHQPTGQYVGKCVAVCVLSKLEVVSLTQVAKSCCFVFEIVSILLRDFGLLALLRLS